MINNNFYFTVFPMCTIKYNEINVTHHGSLNWNKCIKYLENDPLK